MTEENLLSFFKKKRSIVYKIIIALIFALACTPTLLNRVEEVRDAYASIDWPTVTGEITYSNFTDIRCKIPGKGAFCKYEIEYAYSVGESSYKSNRIAFLGKPAWLSVGERFQVFDEVRVFVAPEDPEKSVLIPGADWDLFGTTSYIEVGAWVISLLVIIFLILRYSFITKDPGD